MLVVFRELRRQSRRVGWWGARATVAGLLLVVLIITVALIEGTRRGLDPAAYQELGKVGMTAVHAASLLALGVLTPQVATAAIQAERDDRTLELLAMTGLRPVSVLLSTLMSRVVMMLMLYAGILPVMALLPWLGGVGALDILACAARTLTGALALGAIALPVALATRGPSLPLVGVGSWFIVCGLVIPVRLGYRVHEIGNSWGLTGDQGVASFVPLVELGFPSFDRLVPIVGWWLIPPILAFWAAVWRFRRENGADVADGRAFPGRWVLAVELAILAVGWLIIELTPSDLPEVGDWVAPLALGMCAIAGDAYLRVLCWLLPKLSAARLPIDRTWSLVEPISWRELATRPHGPMNRIMGIATAAYLFVGLLFAAVTEGEVIILWGVLGAVSSMVMTGILVTSLFAEERRNRTWALLRSTTLYAAHITTAKIASVAALIGPFIACAFLFTVVPDENLVFGSLYQEDGGITDPFEQLASALLIILWVAAAWTLHASGITTAVLLFRRASGMWIVGPAAAVVAPSAVVLVLFQLLLLGTDARGLSALENVAALLFPPLANHVSWPFTPLLPQAFSVVIWGFAALCGLLTAAAAASRDPG